MIRILLLTIFLLVAAAGCSTTGGGCTLFPVGNFLTTQAREVVDQSPRAVALPRELDRSVLAAHFLQPGDIIVAEPVRFDTDVRLPADQRVMADGTIDLGGYGRVIVAGLTLEDSERLVEQRIVDAGGEATQINVRLIEPQQVYYVLGEVSSPGAFPLVGSETVLDAILAAGGLTDRASLCEMILVRPTPPPSCRVALPICYRAITQLGDTTTNYQIQPGDRVFVATRSCFDDLAFWRSRKSCDRCSKTHCPCPSPETASFRNPISEYLPGGPAPVEFQADTASGDPRRDVEPLPQPARRPTLPATVQPESATQPGQPAATTEPIRPGPVRPDPFSGDEFFDR